MLREQDVFHSFSVRSPHSETLPNECCYVRARYNSDSVTAAFWTLFPDFKEIKQHLSSCHAYQCGASKVLPLPCRRGTFACSFSLILC